MEFTNLEIKKDDKATNLVEIEIQLSQKPKDETLVGLSNQYNALVNGNVDYNKRPVLTHEAMWNSGWTEFPEDDYATTYDNDYSLRNSSNEIAYTIKVTPIFENRTVLTRSQLESYVFGSLEPILLNGGNMNDVLSYDRGHNKIVINIGEGSYEAGDTWMQALDEQLAMIKEAHLERYFDNQDYDVIIQEAEYEIILKNTINHGRAINLIKEQKAAGIFEV